MSELSTQKQYYKFADLLKKSEQGTYGRMHHVNGDKHGALPITVLWAVNTNRTDARRAASCQQLPVQCLVLSGSPDL